MTGRPAVEWLIVPLLYFVSYSALATLFASAIFVVVWVVVKLRRVVVLILGGTFSE
jgi:hypothetical protein